MNLCPKSGEIMEVQTYLDLLSLYLQDLENLKNWTRLTSYEYRLQQRYALLEELRPLDQEAANDNEPLCTG